MGQTTLVRLDLNSYAQQDSALFVSVEDSTGGFWFMQRSLRSLLLLVILSSVLWPTLAAAQNGRGTITGTVKDSRGLELTSALIELQPSGKRVASDDQGQFRITDVPPGEYTLTTSYVGFARFTAPGKVAPGRTANT